MVLELNKDTFKDAVENNSTIFIDFWAPWCGPCKFFAPVFEKAAQDHPEITFAKVNTEQESELASYFNIRSIPTLMALRDRIIVFEQAGALPESALNEVIREISALDMDEVRKKVAEQGD